MSHIWYIYSNDIVSGPFSTDAIHDGLQEKKWTDESLIWWKGQREWVSISAWKENVASILDSFKTNVKTSAWYVEHLGTQKGPMNAKELQTFILTNGIIGGCRVWANGMERWMSIFEIPELVTFFGISRRKHPRAPLSGEVKLTIDDTGEERSGKVGSISVGGLGIRDVNGIDAGQTVGVVVTSPLLIESIKAQAKIAYANIGHYTGLEFTHLESTQSAIIQSYVQQFKP